MRPLREGLKVVDRFAGFHLDDDLQTVSTFRGRQHEIRVKRRGTDPDRRVLLSSRVDADFVAPLEPALELANDAVVLELFADGPDQNRTQQGLRQAIKIREY